VPREGEPPDWADPRFRFHPGATSHVGSLGRPVTRALAMAVLALGSTLVGGLFALKAKARLPLVLGFTAGILLGVVAFDILPEIVELTQRQALSFGVPMVALVIGFLAFHALEKLVLIHHAQEEAYAGHHHPAVGFLSALALTGHSFLDGIGIGFAFQVSNHTGAIVALAVVAHDFADGMNTVSLMLINRNPPRQAVVMLALDAVAPIAGAASTLFLRLPPAALAIYLGLFGGVLLYIGAADILPEAHSGRSSPVTIVLTCVGTALVYWAAQILR
jgi:zinc transporter ZupT